jgi:hypothetical protein
MSDDLDKQLRDALRPVDPGEPFARGVLARVTSVIPVTRDPDSAGDAILQRRRALRWQWAAVLASVALGTLAVCDWQARRAQGLEARRQLIEALQVTGEKLDIANRAVNHGSRPDSGAQG